MKANLKILESIVYKGLCGFVILMFISLNGFTQNVGINATGSQPNTSAGLDVDFADKGLLIPRVALTGTSNAAPLAAHVAGMMVYNSATAGDVTPGFYFNNGTSWIKVGTANNDFTGDMNNQKITNLASPTEANDAANKTYVDTEINAVTTSTTPCFSVNKNSVNATFANNTYVKVTWLAKVFDTNNDFDLGNSRFKPTVAGKYSLTSAVYVNDMTTGSRVWVAIYKNGSVYAYGPSVSAGGNAAISSGITILVEADGVNDYFEVYVYANSGATRTINGITTGTYFSGYKVSN